MNLREYIHSTNDSPNSTGTNACASQCIKQLLCQLSEFTWINL